MGGSRRHIELKHRQLENLWETDDNDVAAYGRSPCKA